MARRRGTYRVRWPELKRSIRRTLTDLCAGDTMSAVLSCSRDVDGALGARFSIRESRFFPDSPTSCSGFDTQDGESRAYDTGWTNLPSRERGVRSGRIWYGRRRKITIYHRPLVCCTDDIIAGSDRRYNDLYGQTRWCTPVPAALWQSIYPRNADNSVLGMALLALLAEWWPSAGCGVGFLEETGNMGVWVERSGRRARALWRLNGI